MQATRKARKGAAAPPAGGAGPSGHTDREVVEGIFHAYGLPGWLGWGTYGAESSYGATTSGHFFGLIESSYSGQRPNGELVHDTEISARLYKQLVGQYGSVAAAVPHYSGNSYTASHVESLGKVGGKGKVLGGPETVNAAVHLGPLQVWPPPLLESINPFEWLKPNLGETPPGKEVQRVGGGIGSLEGLIEILTNTQTWLRVGEVLGGAVLIYLALKALTGQSLPIPSVIPVPV